LISIPSAVAGGTTPESFPTTPESSLDFRDDSGVVAMRVRTADASASVAASTT
jgi:hypothetical protein